MVTQNMLRTDEGKMTAFNLIKCLGQIKNRDNIYDKIHISELPSNISAMLSPMRALTSILA